MGVDQPREQGCPRLPFPPNHRTEVAFDLGGVVEFHPSARIVARIGDDPASFGRAALFELHAPQPRVRAGGWLPILSSPLRAERGDRIDRRRAKRWNPRRRERSDELQLAMDTTSHVRRVPEIGVRIALGASSNHVVTTAVWQVRSSRVTGVGPGRVVASRSV